MKNYFKEIIYFKNSLSLGERYFLIGIFFLPSAFPIGACSLLISLIIALKKFKNQILNDKWNLPLFVSIGLIIASTINVSVLNIPIELLSYKKFTIWINLFNWIPILFGFFGFQFYLKTESQRINFIKFLIIGTIPVIYSCFAQSFGIYGPFETLYGSIIWFQKSLTNTDGIAGLFSNVNYLTFWFSICLPFTLFLHTNSKNNFHKIFTFIICTSIVIFLISTNSRNAYICLFIIFIQYFNFKKLLFSISSIFGILIIYQFAKSLIDQNFIFQEFLFNNQIFILLKEFVTSYQYAARIQIWKGALFFINQRPFLGWGASTFPNLFLTNYSNFRFPLVFIKAQHAHNLPLELAHNFGIPLSIVLSLTILSLMIKSYLLIKKDLTPSILLNQKWILTCFLVIYLHMSDITYYDGKISLLCCVLFAGLKSILNSSLEKKPL